MVTKSRGWIGPVTALVVAVGIAQAPSARAENIPNDSAIRAELTKSLSNSKFKYIQTSVQKGIVSLTGTVNVYGDKSEADKKAHKLKAVAAVRDDIKVAGPAVPDQVLQLKLMSKIQSDRIGYGTTAFNAISVSVENGVVRLGGSAYGPVDKDAALIDASYTAGVKDVVDNIKVDPLSMMDDRIRVATARAVYGYPSLNKYAIDPVKPIRIVVQNGNVTLEGVVINQADKEVAGLRAKGGFGAFRVTNDLRVANQQSEHN